LQGILLINKSDLTDDWDIEEETLQAMRAEGWTVILSSAKTGEGVAEGFSRLAETIVTQ